MAPSRWTKTFRCFAIVTIVPTVLSLMIFSLQSARGIGHRDLVIRINANSTPDATHAVIYDVKSGREWIGNLNSQHETTIKIEVAVLASTSVWHKDESVALSNFQLNLLNESGENSSRPRMLSELVGSELLRNETIYLPVEIVLP